MLPVGPISPPLAVYIPNKVPSIVVSKSQQRTFHFRDYKIASSNSSKCMFHILITTHTPNALASLTQQAKQVLPLFPINAFSPTFAHQARASSSRSSVPRQSRTTTSSVVVIVAVDIFRCCGEERARGRFSGGMERRLAAGMMSN